MASYFSNFPNVYVGEGITSNEGFKYRLTKNISRRVKVRDDLDQYVTSFEAYSIQDGESPSFLANAIFGDPFLDWIILLSNNITDFYTQWPKSEENLQAFVRDAYTDPDAIHHYETNEILYEDIVYIKEGSSVTDGFRVVMPDGSIKTAEESRYPVSNYEYEHYLNEQKRLIGIPNGVMVDLMQEEMQSLLEYESNPEVDKFGNKKTPMSMASRFITNDTSVNKTTIEVIEKKDDQEPQDKLWGLAWEVKSIEDAHKRISDEGVDISPIKEGIKENTLVATIKSHTHNVPTLLIEHI